MTVFWTLWQIDCKAFLDLYQNLMRRIPAIYEFCENMTALSSIGFAVSSEQLTYVHALYFFSLVRRKLEQSSKHMLYLSFIRYSPITTRLVVVCLFVFFHRMWFHQLWQLNNLMSQEALLFWDFLFWCHSAFIYVVLFMQEAFIIHSHPVLRSTGPFYIPELCSWVCLF